MQWGGGGGEASPLLVLYYMVIYSHYVHKCETDLKLTLIHSILELCLAKSEEYAVTQERMIIFTLLS